MALASGLTVTAAFMRTDKPHKVGPPGLPTAAKRVAFKTQDSSATEGIAMKRRWNSALQSLVLVRIGQELGTDSQAARAVHDVLELLAVLASAIARSPN